MSASQVLSPNNLGDLEGIWPASQQPLCGFASPWHRSAGRGIFVAGTIGLDAPSLKRDVQQDLQVLPSFPYPVPRDSIAVKNSIW